MIVETYKHKGLRKQLVEELEGKGITDIKVLQSIGQIPRHIFFEKALEQHAYEDKAFPIGNNQTISQPYTVAQQTSLLNLKKRDRILEIGTGCGYQTSVLAHLCSKITSIERIKSLHLLAKKNLHYLKINHVELKHADGNHGCFKNAPYDKIIVTAGAPILPEKLFSQLKINGQMVIPLGQQNQQEMFRYTKLGASKISKENFGRCAFVPLINNVI